MPMLYMGKTVDECSREELLQIIAKLEQLNLSDTDFRVVQLRSRVDALTAENEKLWKCLGNRN